MAMTISIACRVLEASRRRNLAGKSFSQAVSEGSEGQHRSWESDGARLSKAPNRCSVSE